MNKTEYMNTLKEELVGLPKDVIDETLWFYDKQFEDGLAAGQSEVDISDKLPKPRLVAAQKRAGMQYQKFKNKMTPTNFAGLFFAFVGVMVFNFFMLIPAAMYSVALFTSYMASFALYGGGIALIAASLSGVPNMQLTLPGIHKHHSSEHYRIERNVDIFLDEQKKSMHRIALNIDEDAADELGNEIGNEIERELATNLRSHNRDVVININEEGIRVQKNGKTVQYSSEHNVDEEELHEGFSKPKKYESHHHVVNIKNHLEKKYGFYGLALLLSGIGLLLFCLFMTKMTFVWFKRYLLWNLSLLRAPNNSI